MDVSTLYRSSSCSHYLYMLPLAGLFYILVTICICGCTSKSYPAILLTADSLTMIAPDSAIVLLRQISPMMADEKLRTQRFYQLLCIKAADKAYLTHTSDSLILVLLDFYESTQDKDLLPDVYYYAGRIYRDLGDAPQALEYFHRALDALPDGTGSRQRPLINSQMGTLFSLQGMHDKAITCFQHALNDDKIRQDSVDILFDLQDLGFQYRNKQQIDSSLFYYRQALCMAHNLQNSCFINMISAQIAGLYKQIGQYELALKTLTPSLSYVRPQEASSIYSTASELYHRLGQTDSAIYYYKKMLEIGTVYAKQAACQGMALIAIERKQAEDAIYYSTQYQLYTDSVKKLTQTESVQKMQSLYNYQLRERENNRLEQDNLRKEIIIQAETFVCLLLLIAVYAIYYHYKKRKAELARNLRDLERAKEKKRLLNGSIQPYDWQQQQSQLLRNFQDTPICRMIEERLLEVEQRTNILSEKEWQTFEATISHFYPTFVDDLRALHPFSKYELRVCQLIKANLNPAKIARLTNHSKEAVSSTRRRMYEKAFGRKGSPSDWDEYIMSI